MLKIGDFSKLTHISVRMLRYYDSQGLLKPAVTDQLTGYRMYTAEQVPELQKIIMLRDLNFGVGEIKELMQSKGDEKLILHLQNKLVETEELILLEKKRIDNINSAISHIEAGKLEQFYNVTIKSIPSCPVISLRRKVGSYFDEGKLWVELCDFIQKEHIECDKRSPNSVTVYYNDEYLESDIDMEVCITVKRLGESKGDFTYHTLEPVENMACMMVYGAYENIADAYRSFAEWLENNEPYMMGNTSRQVTVIDHQHTDNPEEYLTEIQIPLVKG